MTRRSTRPSARCRSREQGGPHEARRSQLARASYALTQPQRARDGAGVLAGNHVVLQRDDGGYVALAHLRGRLQRGRRRARVTSSMGPESRVMLRDVLGVHASVPTMHSATVRDCARAAVWPFWSPS
jgi:hypothetical protein